MRGYTIGFGAIVIHSGDMWDIFRLGTSKKLAEWGPDRKQRPYKRGLAAHASLLEHSAQVGTYGIDANLEMNGGLAQVFAGYNQSPGIWILRYRILLRLLPASDEPAAGH